MIPLPEDVSISEPDPRNIPLPLDPMLEPVNSQDQDTSDQLVLPGTFSAERWVHRLAGEYRDDSKSIGLEGDPSDVVLDDAVAVAGPDQANMLNSIVNFDEKLYCLLELISEQGSGGLVDKVIIAQKSLGRFINKLSPGSYTSVTKVDFRVLDAIGVRPIGVYGSRESIVSLLVEAGVVDDTQAHELLRTDGSGNEALQSGLYIALPLEWPNASQVYLVYWPERDTWRDNAPSPVRRNRITFMRYLTKIAHQILCLFSDNESKSFVWNDDASAKVDGVADKDEEEEEDEEDDDDDDDDHRMFSFEVAKTLEQDENVTCREGFNIIMPHDHHPGSMSMEKDVPRPIVLAGETAQGFLSVRQIEPQVTTSYITDSRFNLLQLQGFLATGAIKINPKARFDTIEILVNHGLSVRFYDLCAKAKEGKEVIDESLVTMERSNDEASAKALSDGYPRLEETLLLEILKRVQKQYSGCKFPAIEERCAHLKKDSEDPFSVIAALYEPMQAEFDRIFDKQLWDPIKSSEFQKVKKRLVMAEVCLQESGGLAPEKKNELLRMIFVESDVEGSATAQEQKQTLFSRLVGFFSDRKDERLVLESKANNRTAHLSDRTFIRNLSDPSRFGGPIAATAISKAIQLATLSVEDLIQKCCSQALNAAKVIQLDFCKAQNNRFIQSERHSRYSKWQSEFVHDVEEIQRRDKGLNAGQLQIQIVRLDNLLSPHRASGLVHQVASFKVSGSVTTFTPPFLEYTIHTFGLSSEDRQNLQWDQSYVPKPDVNVRFSSSFQLPPNHLILSAQLVASDRLLLVIDDQDGKISIYLDNFTTIGNALDNHRTRKVIRQEKTGKKVLVAFDESKHLVALLACAKGLLYIFQFDEAFAALQSWAHPVDLNRWYDAGPAVIHMCFVCGNEELLLVDNHGQARIFSLITQQCRPASLHFHQVPVAIYPSPDESCFFALFVAENGAKTVRGYHWTTFGSSNGISIELDIGSKDQLALTSFVNRSSVHLLLFNLQARKCRSYALDITKKATEFVFQQKSALRPEQKPEVATINNCLLDCHQDVWSRFPVVPAVGRQTLSPKKASPPRRLVCVSSDGQGAFSTYYTAMIKAFEQRTRKPTGKELRSIVVESTTLAAIRQSFLDPTTHDISLFQAGDWIVNILCLIPVHIAVTRENRFIPLKDGVSSVEYEKSLLGADISTVVDSISFGWYESILQSYMAAMPVKVVSSMGEQSVGKSYSLNHLVDTSFAGSAMRTTEGVWMSVTPTDDVLLVALDFEGVHSIERSTQEDTLLVLFNTAISNLVLFRNNFALSRDITGLFQSFQSSSVVFDPAANPTLFRSTLVIIIKDVIESDTAEIVREFSSKFQKIVQDEQESNFISRLHAGKLDIVPWPVIESKQFYTYFRRVKVLLDKQPVTHGTAGNFLRTMKTLMAKLKANDWRALSQSMAAHRAHRIMSILPNALAFGYSEIEPHPEPLKDLDSDAIIDYSDTSSQFVLSDLEPSPGQRDRHLKQLCQSWDGYAARSEHRENDWVPELSAYLTRLVDIRVEHVRLWIAKNLETFKGAPHASITALYRTFEATVIDIKANSELCKQTCNSCQLLCLLNRRHEGKDHDCLSSHKCLRICEFAEGHAVGTETPCGYPAGHSGKHICVVDNHLCGEPCILNDKIGCLGECTMVASQEVHEHRCSSRLHACGKPCQLSCLQLPMPSMVCAASDLCSGSCAISTDVVHNEHLCENRMCPVKCRLCNRLCASDDHLHAMRDDIIHLCGEIHSCGSLCSADGICEIDTAPQSIEAVFTGRHETFQYTKYSQVAKRLPCVIPIPAMEITHAGGHSHTEDSVSFHFCETRCLYCGYYCTLPRGHSQQEHETSHGSMSKTRWAIEDQDVIIELKGRNFGLDDEGAPLMCNLFCQDMGRHVHINYCRADSEGVCNGPEVEHIDTRINPNPEKPKDWITHELYWKRSGFKDPYSRDDRTNFSKCDAMCPGPEHTTAASNAPQPSYCTLPLFHAPSTTPSTPGSDHGYTSHDGHHYMCKNPPAMQQAFHVIFVIDRSSSMGSTDRRPLAGTPTTNLISARYNNRLGAVYSALYSFWTSRQLASGGQPAQPAPRRDAYSVILFDEEPTRCVENNFISSSEELLDSVMRYGPHFGTDFGQAIQCAEDVMRQHWNTERAPVVIFLSDGECSLEDEDMRTLCRAAISLGKPLSFHGVAFGTYNRTLFRMVGIARRIQATVPGNPLVPQTATIESSFAEALDTVQLAETFLGLAESLKKPRGALLT